MFAMNDHEEVLLERTGDSSSHHIGRQPTLEYHTKYCGVIPKATVILSSVVFAVTMLFHGRSTGGPENHKP